jgi:hypothetical protein
MSGPEGTPALPADAGPPGSLSASSMELSEELATDWPLCLTALTGVWWSAHSAGLKVQRAGL